MHITRIRASNFRNYRALDLELPERGAFFSGPNGSGKSNLLEAIHFLCTGRSHRGAPRKEMVRFGEPYCRVEGTFLSGPGKLSTTVAAAFGTDGGLELWINGEKISSFARWFGGRPVVSFNPHDLLLVQGPPRERRRFLDMTISQIDGAYLEHLIAYRRVLLQRNRLYADRIDDPALLRTYSGQMAEHGVHLCEKRLEFVRSLAPVFADMHGKIGADGEAVSLRYEPSFAFESCGENPWNHVFLQALQEREHRDRTSGFSTLGPHRDDVAVTINGRSARRFASQGQCRSIVLAVRMGSAEMIKKIKRESPVFLIDDAFSELDTRRASRIIPMLEFSGQTMYTSPSDHVPLPPEMTGFTVYRGTVLPV